VSFTSEQIVKSIDLHYRRCEYLNWRQLVSHRERLSCPECLPPVAVVTEAAREPVPA